MATPTPEFLRQATLARYVEAYPPREPFVPHATETLAWRTATTRFRMGWERSADIGYGLGRNEELADAGIDSCTQDTQQFAQDVLAGLGDNISLSDLDALVEVFQAAADKWRRERAQMLEQLEQLS